MYPSSPFRSAIEPLATPPEARDIVAAGIEHLPFFPRPLSAAQRATVTVFDAERRDYTLSEAYAYCGQLCAERSARLPFLSARSTQLAQQHQLAVRAFVGAALLFTTDPAYESRRRAALEQWQLELELAYHGEADHPLFVALRHTIHCVELPIPPFVEFLTGCLEDLTAPSYLTFAELRSHCDRRAGSLGQLVLMLLGYRTPSLFSFSAELCVARELVTILRQLPADLRRGRCYLPLEDLSHFGISMESLQAIPHGDLHLFTRPQWRNLVRFQVARTRALLERGRPLLDELRAEDSLEWKLFYRSSLATIERIEQRVENLGVVPSPAPLDRS